MYDPRAIIDRLNALGVSQDCPVCSGRLGFGYSPLTMFQCDAEGNLDKVPGTDLATSVVFVFLQCGRCGFTRLHDLQRLLGED